MRQASAPRFGGIGWRDLRRPRIGLVWSGKPTHKNDHNRSIALSRLKPLLSVAGTQFVSLQREYRASDLAALDQLPIRRIDRPPHRLCRHGGGDRRTRPRHCRRHSGGAPRRGNGQAAMAACAACAGLALVARPHDSPWYPTAKLFRQPQIGWTGQLQQWQKRSRALRRPASPWPSDDAGQFFA